MLRQAAIGPLQLNADVLSRSAQEVRRRAARALAALGLIEVYMAPGYSAWGSWCRRLLHIKITDLGRAVLATFAREFETGARIRWAKFEAHAAV